MDDMDLLGFVTVDYTHITDIQERTMETLSVEELIKEVWEGED